MQHENELLSSLMARRTLTGLEDAEALNLLGRLIDLSLDVKRIDAVHHALEWARELERRVFTPSHLASFHYCVAGAWAHKRTLSPAPTGASDWEQEELEKEIIHLRLAISGEGLSNLPPEGVCSIYTNLGTAMNAVGRVPEGITYLDGALAHDPAFAMAKGNKGCLLAKYASALHDPGHRAVLFQLSHTCLTEALSAELHEAARKHFAQFKAWVESRIVPEDISRQLGSPALGCTEEEAAYRRWTLDSRLFVNPLNDGGAFPIAARDVMTLPDMIRPIREGPWPLGLFNQLKQEFVSARFMFYEGMTADRPHFSDREVVLYNTLDYPSHCLAVEKMKCAFRLAYSIFDKVAYFLNGYFQLNIDPNRSSFRNLWYKDEKRENGLRGDLTARDNWPLKALFWLGKDLYENRPGFTEALEPVAKHLRELRNHLEHKYLKVHDEMWLPGRMEGISGSMVDHLAYSIQRSVFTARVLKLLGMARAALVYLSLAVRFEEIAKGRREGSVPVLPAPISTLHDDWKF
jgi:hypothetical protein